MLTIYKTKLIQKTKLSTDVYLFKFSLDDPKEINFNPGQYLILRIKDQSRLYSIASPSFIKDSFEILVKLIPNGLASDYLLNLKVGDLVNFSGPAGFFTLKSNLRHKIFLCTGTGIAPIRSILISHLTSQPSKCYIFWGLPYFSEVYFLNEFKPFNLQICLSRETDFKMIPKEDRKYFFLGYVNDALEKKIKQGEIKIEDCDFYLCGSRQIVESLRIYLKEKGIFPNQIFFEKF